MERIRVDLWQSWRSISARPGVTLATSSLVALGVGLMTCMFAITDPFLLRPLPFGRSNELALISRDPSAASDNWADDAFVDTTDWTSRSDLFQDAALYRPGQRLTLLLPGGAILIRPLEASDNFLRVLQVTADILPAQQWDPTAVPLILRRAVQRAVTPDNSRAVYRTHEGLRVQIVGLLPDDFLFPSYRVVNVFNALIPRSLGELIQEPRDGSLATVLRSYTVVARLRQGVPPSAVAVALAGSRRVTVESLFDHMTKRVRPLALGALLSGVAMLALCIGNIVNLLIARGVYRRSEFATRTAVGARRSDLIRLIVVELAVVTLVGVAAGFTIAYFGLMFTGLLAPAEYLVLGQPGLSSRAIMVGCLTGLVIVAVASGASWIAVRESGLAARRARNTTSVRVLRIVMTSAQAGLTMVLLVVGSLLARSYLNITTQDSGWPLNPLVVTVLYPDQPSGLALREDINSTLERLRRIIGVDASAAAFGPMVDQVMMSGGVKFAGRFVVVMPKRVTRDYFSTVGSRLLAGRWLGPEDARQAGAIVNETFARRYGAVDSIVGQPLGGGSGRIVGVVQDSFDVAFDRPPDPTIFWLLEAPPECSGDCNRVSYVLKLRPGHAVAFVVPAARRAVTEINASAVVEARSVLSERLNDSIKDRAFATLILGVFAIAGVAICTAGIVGLVTFIVGRRTKEISICVALGATGSYVLRMVMSEALLGTTIGVFWGAIAGNWASRGLEHMLYGLKPDDYFTLAASGALMVALCTVAAMFPARRALAIPPTLGLRVD